MSSNCKHCKKDTKNKKDFCSPKCEDIFQLLKKENLNSFYNKSLNHQISTSSKNISYQDINTLAFEEEFIKKDENENSHIKLFISNITCSACIWLNENILLKQNGILSANINMSNKIANISWDDKKIKIAKIFELIQSIGYEAFPYNEQIAYTQIKKQSKEYISKLWVAFFATFNIMMIDVAKYNGIFTFIENDVKFIFHIAEFILATLVFFYSGSLFFKKAFYGMKNKNINMDFLVSLGSGLTYIYSIWVLYTKNGETYFDSVVMILAFVLLGKYLELLSRQKSIETINKIQDIPTMVNKISENNKILSTLARNIKEKDTILINNNEKIIIDGIISKGSGYFDTSIVSGESEPQYKKIGDKLISGSISLDEDMQYIATSTSKNSFLGKLSNILQTSLSKKLQKEEKIAKISSYFALLVLFLSFLTFITWYFLYNNFNQSLIISISVLVIACPCSLALAIPISSMLSLNSLIRKNIICKNIHSLDEIKEAKYFVFDKTKTLTNGIFSVISHEIKDNFNISLLYGIVQNSNHPISIGVKKFIQDNYNNIDKVQIVKIKEIPSRGIEANISLSKNTYKILAGNRKLLEENNIQIKDNLNINSSILLIAQNNEYMGYIKLEDKIKDEAKEVIDFIKSQNIIPIIYSGDNEVSSKKVANKLEIDYKANLSPKDKENLIKKLQKKNKVLMLGDGLNDVLALKTSNLSISFYTSENITTKSSDILLRNNNLKNIIHIIKIAKTYQKLIKQNLNISFAYNATTIPLAIFGFISPLIAAISMSLSSLIVVISSMILVTIKTKKRLKTRYS